ncbi:MAG: ABC transporter substrate-binding protein [Actinomycetota bacterium]
MLATAAALLFASACGDDDDSSTTSPAPTTMDAAAEGPADTTPATTQVDQEVSDDDMSDDTSPPAATVEAGATRIADTVYGPVEVPVDAERVFALDEYAGAVMLSVGIEPVAAFQPYDAVVSTQLLDEAGVELVPATFGEWNYEAIAAYEPDLIVLTDTQDPAVTEQLSDIAPAVTLPFVAPWRDGFTALGSAAGQEERTDAAVAELEQRLASVAAQADGAVMSVLGTGPVFGTYTIGSDTPTAQIIAEAGYARPDTQAEPANLGALFSLSPEVLGDHDGDIVVAYGGNPGFYDADALAALPTYAALPAAQDGRTVEVLGEVWINSDPFSMFWVIEDLAAIADGGQPATLDDVGERWVAFLELGQ